MLWFVIVDLSPGEVVLDPAEGWVDVRSSLPVSILAGNLLPRQQCNSPEIRVSTPRDKVSVYPL